ncbi:hypothetical protein [Halotia branconii]|uniref:Uncharacterized protein n=1 Tax=Halotia branconii CENA392 TaxID=1539056 RepID=A0AAJ6NUY8_9CYAN|nr:hypothetical protein [Halotia branconii]WGV27065.1 hypothetical protein QI031_06100 [Halotia branconii CENA392]
MSDTTVFLPDYYRIFERRTGEWFLKTVRLIHKELPFSVDLRDFKLLYGITDEQIGIELFRINGGKSGYYLANLRHKRFYYCGTGTEGVKTKLRSLGIGREDPMQ